MSHDRRDNRDKEYSISFKSRIQFNLSFLPGSPKAFGCLDALAGVTHHESGVSKEIGIANNLSPKCNMFSPS